MKFSIKDFFSKFLQKTADLVTFTEEILNGKLHFLCSAFSYDQCKNKNLLPFNPLSATVASYRIKSIDLHSKSIEWFCIYG